MDISKKTRIFETSKINANTLKDKKMKSNRNELVRAMKEVENLVENINSAVGLEWKLTFVSFENGVVKFYVTCQERKDLGINHNNAYEVKWGYQEGEYNYNFERWFMHSLEVGKCTFDKDGYQIGGDFKFEVFID